MLCGNQSNVNGESHAEKHLITTQVFVEAKVQHIVHVLEDLQKRITVLEETLNALMLQADALEERYSCTTIRKAIKILETCICLEAVGGSKRKIRSGFYNINRIQSSNDAVVKTSLQKVLIQRGITEDHIAMMEYFKESCFSTAPMTRDAWDEWITEDELQEASVLDDSDPEKADLLANIKIKKELLCALEYYQPCQPGQKWILTDPLAK